LFLPALHLGRETIEVLLVGRGNELCNALVVLDRVESLSPFHQRAAAGRLEIDAQEEMVTVYTTRLRMSDRASTVSVIALVPRQELRAILPRPG
jgi:hypothetical protein